MKYLALSAFIMIPSICQSQTPENLLALPTKEEAIRNNKLTFKYLVEQISEDSKIDDLESILKLNFKESKLSSINSNFNYFIFDEISQPIVYRIYFSYSKIDNPKRMGITVHFGSLGLPDNECVSLGDIKDSATSADWVDVRSDVDWQTHGFTAHKGSLILTVDAFGGTGELPMDKTKFEKLKKQFDGTGCVQALKIRTSDK